MKAPGEHERLARVFDIPPTRTTFAVVTTASAAFIGVFVPIGLVIAGGLTAGLGGIALGDRRRVREHLQEISNWGFPVDGYRAWLLADDPTFDITLAHDVDLELLSTSVRAVDPAIIVERAKSGALRIVTRRIALPPRKAGGPVIHAGDRRLLHELHQRILAPLHADVGIRHIQMGDRARMPDARLALPAPTQSAAPSAGMGAFREQAMAASPTLQALVDGGTDREMPREARRLSNRAERVVHAIGSAPYGAGTVIAFTFGGLTSGAGWFEVVGMGVGAVAGFIGGVAAAVQGNRRNAQKVAASVSGHGFSIDGYNDWLLSGRPLLDIELSRTIDRAWLETRLATLPRAFSVSINGEVSWVEDVMWFDDRTVRIETRPTLVTPASRFEPFYGGSHQMFATFVEQVLLPLHAHAGITVLRMGGYIDRRL